MRFCIIDIYSVSAERREDSFAEIKTNTGSLLGGIFHKTETHCKYNIFAKCAVR